MVLVRSFIAGLALAGAAVARPRGYHAHRRGSAHALAARTVTVFDETVTAPTLVPDKVVWLADDDTPTSTAIETVLVLPDEYSTRVTPTPSPRSVTKSTLTSTSTETVVVMPVEATSEPGAFVEAPQPAAAAAPEGIPEAAVAPDAASDVVPEISASGSPAVPVVPLASAKPVGKTSDPPNKKPSSAASHAITHPGPKPATSVASVPEGDRFGVSYAPYRADHSCKSQSDIENDLTRLKGQYSLIRIYGTDCDQVQNVYAVAKPLGMKLFLGIWDINAVQPEASTIIDAINGDWDMVHTVSVGNELVNGGMASPGQVVSAVKAARPILRAAGYQGPVVTVDTFIAAEDHPELCDASDYCAINAHPFFDSTITADQAGRWLAGTVSRVASGLANPNKKVVVTETGWPTAGSPNGAAVPGMGAQKQALSGIRDAFVKNPGDVILFSAYNDLWKTKTMATFDADQYWGIDGAVSACDE